MIFIEISLNKLVTENDTVKKFIVNLPIVIIFILLCLKLADAATFSIAVGGSNAINLVSFAIFVFVLAFLCTFKLWEKTIRKNIVVCIIIYCCLNVFIVHTNFGVMCIRRTPESAKVKSCWSNIRVITGAVEMYNMDNSIMMDKLDFDLLLKGKYLKQMPEGYYANHGKLTEDGYVYCVYHLKPDEAEAYGFMGSKTYEKLYSELKNEIELIKKERYDKKPNSEKLIDKFDENWPTIQAIFYPILVAFFPYTLHPIRN